MSKVRKLACVVALLVATISVGFSRQVPADPSQERLPPFPGQLPKPIDENQARIEKEMAKKANLSRQQEIKRDTDQLLKLATELKESVDKSNENTLSLEVVRKAEEVEKLARNVKEKMRAAY